jgi:ketosteroid isomerase-like protein
MSLTENEVAAAARKLVDAFGSGDTGKYFACFAPEATFLFHSEAGRLESREQYEKLWRGWLDEGWRVVDCASTNSRIQLAGSSAVFMHDVETTIDVNGTRETLRERETIVFAKAANGELLAVHEHLSPAPAA